MGKFSFTTVLFLFLLNRSVFAENPIVEDIPDYTQVALRLTEAALHATEVLERRELIYRLKQPQYENAPLPPKPKLGFDFFLSFPEGAGARISYRIKRPIELALVTTSNGTTVIVSADATIKMGMGRGFDLFLSMEFMNIVFTGVANGFITSSIPQPYATTIQTRLAGSYMAAGSAHLGADWTDPRTHLHLFGSIGFFRQIGSMSVGDDQEQNVVEISGLWGPIARLGLGGRFK